MGALAITVVVGAGLLIGVGAYLGSEVLTSLLGVTAGGPEVDGLLVIPAVITGLVLSFLADAFARYIAFEPA